MNVMQALSDWKQNLHNQAHPSLNRTAANGAITNRFGTKAINTSPLAGRSLGPVETADTSSGSSSPGSTTITANDFLQLLVAEMKNQDPTADQDPNAYIDQLVQVNSLQQLISINQDLNPTGSIAGGSAAGALAAGSRLGSAEGSAAAAVATSLGPKETPISNPRWNGEPHPVEEPVARPDLHPSPGGPSDGNARRDAAFGGVPNQR